MAEILPKEWISAFGLRLTAHGFGRAGDITMDRFAPRFAQIFWGVFLSFFSLKINGFDLLPDVIGYILMAVGLGGVGEISGKFSTASVCAWIMSPISVVGMIPSRTVSELAIIVMPFSLVFGCTLIWSMLGGIIDFATDKQRSDLAERAVNRRLAFVIALCVGTIAGFLGRDAVILVIPVAIVLAVLTILILHLIHRVKHELCN